MQLAHVQSVQAWRGSTNIQNAKNALKGRGGKGPPPCPPSSFSSSSAVCDVFDTVRYACQWNQYAQCVPVRTWCVCTGSHTHTHTRTQNISKYLQTHAYTRIRCSREPHKSISTHQSTLPFIISSMSMPSSALSRN